MPNVISIGQDGGNRSPSIITKLSKFAAFNHIGATVFTDYSEIKHAIAHHGTNLSCQIWP